MKNKGTWIIVGIVAAFVLLIAGIFVSTNNRAVSLEEQRGKEVFEQLLGNAFPPDMIVAKNCNISEDAVKDLAMDHSIIMVRGNGQADVTAYSCGVYYMPEE